MTSAVTPGRGTSAGATPETCPIAGRGRASSSVGICAPELHEAFTSARCFAAGIPIRDNLSCRYGRGGRRAAVGRHRTRRSRRLRDNAAWTGGLKGHGCCSLKLWRMTRNGCQPMNWSVAAGENFASCFKPCRRLLSGRSGGRLPAGMPWGRVKTSAGYVSSDWPGDHR